MKRNKVRFILILGSASALYPMDTQIKNKQIDQNKVEGRAWQCQFDKLPDEIIIQIMSKLASEETINQAMNNLFNTSLTTKRFNLILKDLKFTKNITNYLLSKFGNQLNLKNGIGKKLILLNCNDKSIFKFLDQLNSITPLSYAVIDKNIALVNLLIKSGTNANEDAALNFSVLSGDVAITEILLRNGAKARPTLLNLNRKNKEISNLIKEYLRD